MTVVYPLVSPYFIETSTTTANLTILLHSTATGETIALSFHTFRQFGQAFYKVGFEESDFSTYSLNWAANKQLLSHLTWMNVHLLASWLVVLHV